MSADIVPLEHSALASVAPNYERMRLAIAECSRLDEVANLADQAVAAQAYFRQSQDLGNEIDASRIRVRAERRLGEILTAMAANGERASKQSTLKQGPMLPKATSVPTLDDLKIPRDRASRAMQIAEVPEPEFEAALAEPRVAQPRRILAERRPAAAGDAAAIAPPIANWARRVLAIRDGFPNPDGCRATLAAADIASLRSALPEIIRCLEQLRVAICLRCDGEGCVYCLPSTRRHT